MAYEGTSEICLDDFYYSRNDKVGRGTFGIVYKGREQNVKFFFKIPTKIYRQTPLLLSRKLKKSLKMRNF
jgi:hypothetical protein